MYFCYFLIIFPWKRSEPFIWTNLSCHHPSMICAKFDSNWFLRRRFLNFINVFSLFRNYLPLEKVGALCLYKFEYPSTNDTLCQVWLKLAQWFCRKGDFYISSMNFHYFVIISPLKRTGPFIWTNLNPLHPMMHCARFCWNWSSCSGEEGFLNFVNVFLLCYYLPLEKGLRLRWANKTTSYWSSIKQYNI